MSFGVSCQSRGFVVRAMGLRTENMNEEHVMESLQTWKRVTWMGKIIGFLFAMGFAGFCVCYVSLLHSFHGGYSPIHYGMVAQELKGFAHEVTINGSSEKSVVEAGQEEEYLDSYLDLVSGSSMPGNKNYSTDLQHIVFGIGASALLWETRKEYVKLWWKPKEMRGFVWLDKPINGMKEWEFCLPAWRISGNTSEFKYTHKHGWRSSIRLSRIVAETFRQGLPDVHWFVMGDDDTVFVPQNLVTVLSKYDHTQFYYIGGNSESHIQNQFFSFNMAFGGGGFAISYPLARALESMQDKCLTRYHHLFGSDDRVQACVVELGVPLTREPGFHQLDIIGKAWGLLAAHPIAPLVSLHHMEVLEPLFSGRSRVESVRHILQAASFDPAALLQQSICYDRRRRWSISVSWGYIVQIMRGLVSPRDLERPLRTFSNWQNRDDFMSYPFNTRPFPTHPCDKPLLFELHNISHSRHSHSIVMSEYRRRDEEQISNCSKRIASPHRVETIRVFKRRDDYLWFKEPRRNCCTLRHRKRKSKIIDMEVAPCKDGEIITMFL
ncbi:uncharacterized protein LOC131030401 [Cryptomeria japonica]|uniref:uncharacterized protein LOC131030401 n=1 Tax=Cryptomeria japonica TaxID=3369 RepID=UPI0027DA54AF|nr:uncharacterized protein LOC131030401 [Cryptomeria japonica]XP_057817207.2 uncharacterized protein LOC131030401 [Cryptomeria japonica]XP_057817208.2 uncharacterized protein LOC131030401 [Cryptomeria japonica]